MKQHSLIGILTVSISLALGSFSIAQQMNKPGKVESLRGAALDEQPPAEQVFHQDENRFVRNYRQQPPLIPHTIAQYQIDLAANECLSCHDWTNAGDRGAPTLSMTHYLDREGNQLDTIAGTRWFCNQCHVPQANAPELVENTFGKSN
ncbi:MULTISPECIES: nitrate reductase cytochrome c-type subunit [Cohaesibacter]|uniref:nitrate reductase cytochrome c-type subunit n=1 Tax=Cohaesibacter TaxID=655352 RepID=UPI000DEB288A|nr:MULTISPECIES: nitrate reductase cytochrome c-type subunit [Cohaesibacter]TLP48100.1 nitrate reductase cytochrome c-type subunit [Cohaesibacter sp. CAU 1516]